MSDWANALMSGLGAAANTGANIIGEQMKQDAALQAEQRAADIKLDTQERIMAMEQAMKARAAERFSSIVKDQMGTPVPVSAPTWQSTGLTDASTIHAGDQLPGANASSDDDEDGGQPSGNTAPVGISFHGDATKIAGIMKTWTAVLNDPNATPEQKEAAKAIVEGLPQQIAKQQQINADSVAGKTRAPTIEEATESAKNWALQNDATAYIAGTGMLDSAEKNDLQERRLTLAEKQAQQKAASDQARMDSNERIAAGHDAQREQAADQRFQALMAKLDAGANGGKSGKSAMVQNLEWMRDNLNFTPQQLTDYVTEKKHLAPEDIAAKLLSADKFGELTPETAMQRAMQLVKARDAMDAGGQGGASSSSTSKVLNYDPKTGKFN
jgi:hypothetical protein